jgi:hypothetical protein
VRRPRELAQVGAEVALPTRRLSRRVRDLETAVVENAALEVPLSAQVDRLEAALVPLLEAARAATAPEPSDDH